MSHRPDAALAASLREFGPLGILSILGILAGNLLFVPLSAILVLLWAHHSQTPWRAIGFVRPASWVGDLAVGICFGAALKMAMKAIVMPLLGADPINAAYHHLVGNTAALPGMLYAVVVGAGFGEEVVFRGYLFERLRRLTRKPSRSCSLGRAGGTMRAAPNDIESVYARPTTEEPSCRIP